MHHSDVSTPQSGRITLGNHNSVARRKGGVNDMADGRMLKKKISLNEAVGEIKPNLARQFFETLFSAYLKEAARPAYIEVRGKRESDKDMTFRRFYLGIDLLIKDMSQWPADRHYWYGVALRWSDTQGKKEHCLVLTVIFTDVDYGTAGHKKKNRWETREEAQAAIDAFPIKPAIVVHTGGGFQLYWILSEPFGFENGNYAKVEATMKGIGLAIGGDDGTQDVSRIFRIPGTFNVKTNTPRPVEIVEFHPDRIYDLADFSHYADQVRQEQEQTRQEAPPRDGPQTTDIDALNIPGWVRGLIRTADSSGYGNDRSVRDHAVIGALVRAGCDLDTIEAIFREHPIGDKYREKSTHGRAYLAASYEKVASTVGVGPEPSPKSQKRQEPITEVEPPMAISIIPAWPDGLLTGAAGRFAQAYIAYLETPAQFLFMNHLTLLGHLISDKITLASEIRPQPRLYTVNLGESAETRKTTSIDKPVDLYLEFVEAGEINPVRGVGSAEGLAKLFEKHRRAILILDELKALIQKMQIKGSVLLPCINTLFESTHYHNHTRNHDIKIDNGELCLLGASTLETYRNMFTPQFMDIGFLNRIFIVIGEGERKFSIPAIIPEQERAVIKGDLREVLQFVGEVSRAGRYAMPITPRAKEIFDVWYHRLEKSAFAKRLDTYGHRLMPLLAVNEMKDSITPEIAEQTVALLNYQLAARKFADPVDADNAIARVEEKIRRLLTNGPVGKRDLEKHGHKHRVGIWHWGAAIKNLRGSGEIGFDEKSKIYRLVQE